MAGIELERMLEAQDRFRRAPHVGEGVTEISPQIRVVRIELHRLVEGLEGLFAPSLVEQRGAEACQIFCPGLLPDRAGYPFHRVVVLPAWRDSRPIRCMVSACPASIASACWQQIWASSCRPA